MLVMFFDTHLYHGFSVAFGIVFAGLKSGVRSVFDSRKCRCVVESRKYPRSFCRSFANSLRRGSEHFFVAADSADRHVQHGRMLLFALWVRRPMGHWAFRGVSVATAVLLHLGLYIHNFCFVKN